MLLFVAAAVVAAAIFVRLGVWQISRLHQRRALNAVVASRLDSTVVDAGSLPRDPMAARYRRARVVGRADYARELIVAARTNAGAPGVWLLTPVHIPGTDTVVIVNRGWVYSPDAATVDPTRWREGDTLDVEGYVLPFEHARGAAALASRPRTLRDADSAAVVDSASAPVLPYMLVALTDSLRRTHPPPHDSAVHTPERLAPPPLDEGPHTSYAIQWFSFAAIALGGAGIAIARRRGDGGG
jgi:surfeit locus 1 family protein